MAYPPQTAGGRMTTEFVAIPPHLTVAAAMRLLRTQAPGAETIYYVFVTEANDKLVGVVSLRDLVVADPQARIADIMRRQVFHVHADVDQEVAAQLLTEHDLLALPVLDDAERLVGVVTVDDVLDVVEQEATEDMYRMAGTALFLNIALVASTTGVVLPMLLRRLGVDPATIAGVFDTMLSDLMGNLIYLGFATLLIQWLL